jgi:hypothetical protein
MYAGSNHLVSSWSWRIITPHAGWVAEDIVWSGTSQKARQHETDCRATKAIVNEGNLLLINGFN